MTGDVDGAAFARAAKALAKLDMGPVAASTIDDIATVVQANVRAARRRHRVTGKGERLVSVHATGQGKNRVARVHAGGRVAHLLTGGTAPHVIRPLSGRAIPLAGRPGSFAAAVHHPGTRPDPFVAAGVAASQGEIRAIADAAVDELAHDLTTAIRRS